MLRDFTNREELITYLREQFPQAAARDSNISETLGGRKAAAKKLTKVDSIAYAKTRNNLNGAVTKLSPYIRHGVFSLREIKDHILDQVEKPEDASKLINELGWRDYWQRLYFKIGNGIWENQEDYKTGYQPADYKKDLPADISASKTGLVCIDNFSQELRETGYLHNHIRMWLAAYIIHWRHIQWQAGAKWFLQHLLDGDPASNNMSWQWVASTFSHKPYFFNRENSERYTKGVYCRQCPLYGSCDFEGSYEELEERLFPQGSFSRKPNSQSWQKGKKRR
jgi:deoxyribodipyrimidine photo-lyase